MSGCRAQNSALYFNASAGVVFEEQKSELLPFYCKYGHENPKILDFVKIEEENRNKSCPLNFTFFPDLPDPCVKSFGGTVEDAEAACNFYGGEIVDLSTPDSVLKRLIFNLNMLSKFLRYVGQFTLSSVFRFPTDRVEIANRGHLYSIFSANEWQKKFFRFRLASSDQMNDYSFMSTFISTIAEIKTLLYYFLPPSFKSYFDFRTLCKIKPIVGKEEPFWKMCRTKSFPNGLPLDFDRSRCVEIASKKTTRAAASEHCTSRGGYLPSPKVEGQSEFVDWQLLQHLKYAVRKIGGTRTWTNISSSLLIGHEIMKEYFQIDFSTSDEICIGLDILSGKENQLNNQIFINKNQGRVFFYLLKL